MLLSGPKVFSAGHKRLVIAIMSGLLLLILVNGSAMAVSAPASAPGRLTGSGLSLPSTIPSTWDGGINKAKAPAYPMGVADYGINGGSSYSYSTTEFVSWANFTALTIGKASNGYNHEMTVQQNLVDYGVMVGTHSGVYWAQDVPYISQSKTRYTIAMLDNIWNFSSPTASMTASSITGNLGSGCAVSKVGTSGGIGFYYCEGSQTFTTTLPFELKMTTTTGSLGPGTYSGDSFVEFTIAVYHGATLLDSLAFDEVAFHSTTTNAPAFNVGGRNPFGTYNDAETVLCGPGGGSTVTISAITAQISESYLNGTLQPIPHAYSYGYDTAETVSGVYLTKLTTNIGKATHGTDNAIQLW